MVAEAWVWLRSRLLRLLPSTAGAVGTTSEEFLLLQFPKNNMDKECVWLLGNYCEIVNSCVLSRWSKLEADHVAGKIRSRLNKLCHRAVVQPSLYNI